MYQKSHRDRNIRILEVTEKKEKLLIVVEE